MDHISAIPQHATKQDLFKMKPATYFVPSHLVEPLQDVADGYYRMHESSESLGKLRIKGIESGDTVHVSTRQYTRISLRQTWFLYDSDVFYMYGSLLSVSDGPW